MTSGRIYLKNSQHSWYESTQLPYDMHFKYPYGHGTEIISGFLLGTIRTEEDMVKYVENLLKGWDLELPDEMEGIIYGDNLQINNLYDDYSYIINCSNSLTEIAIKNETIQLGPDELLALNFSIVVLHLKRVKEPFAIMLSDEETCLCMDALDFYSRMYMGQYDAIDSNLRWAGGYNLNLSGNSFARECLYEAIRSRVFKDTDIADKGLNTSFGIWHEKTDIKGKNAYDMQQIIRYNRAYAIHPEGGYTVDYREPLIKGSLAPIECKCYMKEEICTEEIGLSHEHVLILNEALSIWSMLLRMHISELIGWYTDDVVAIDVSRVLDKMYPKTDIFSEKLDSIVKLQKKILACCGEEIA